MINPNTPPGAKILFNHPNFASDSAKQNLTVGKEYTVKEMKWDSIEHLVMLEEVPVLYFPLFLFEQSKPGKVKNA